MKFDDLDRLMRPYETAYDFCVPMGNHIVVRLDGRGFTRLTKDIWQFDAPFDPRFRDLMTQTVAHLMQCGFNILYGFSQSYRYGSGSCITIFLDIVEHLGIGKIEFLLNKLGDTQVRLVRYE